MGITAGKDYVFVPLVDMNEGLMTGTVTKACMVCTPGMLFMVPIESFTMLGFDAMNTQYAGDPAEFVQDMLSEQYITVQELEERLGEMLSKEPQRWIFDLDDLEKFSVKTGLLGGMTIKRAGEGRKAVNIRGGDNKKAVHEFYEGKMKG